MIEKQQKKDFGPYIENAVLKSKIDPANTFVFMDAHGDLNVFAQDVENHLSHFIDGGDISFIEVISGSKSDLFGFTTGKVKDGFQKEVGKLGGLNAEEYIEMNEDEALAELDRALLEYAPGLEWSETTIKEIFTDLLKEFKKEKTVMGGSAEEDMKELVKLAVERQKATGLDKDDCIAIFKDYYHMDEAKKPLPRRGTPEWNQLDIAKKTMKMTPAMVGVMGGMDIEAAKKLLQEYGLLHEARSAKALAKLTTKRRLMDFKAFRSNKKNIENDSKEEKGQSDAVKASMTGGKEGKKGIATLSENNGEKLMSANQNGKPEPSEYTLVRLENDGDFAIVKDASGKLEKYAKAPHYAGWHLIINDVDYEFVSSDVKESKLNEIDSDYINDEKIKINGIKFPVTIHLWGDQPDVGVSMGIDFDKEEAWENFIKAGLWSEEYFLSYKDNESESSLQFFSVSRTLRGQDNHVSNYDSSDVWDMFARKTEFMNKEIPPDAFVKMVNTIGDYKDIKILDDSEKELKLAAFNEFKTEREIKDLVRSITKADLVKMARGAKDLSEGGEKAVKRHMKLTGSKRPESIESILNLIQ